MAVSGEDLMCGWVQKANASGARWKKRFVVVNKHALTLAWFADDPAFSLAKYHVKEEPLGSISLKGAALITADNAASKVAPHPFLLKVLTADRNQALAFPTKETMERWRAFIARVTDPLSSGKAGDGGAGNSGAAAAGGAGAGGVRASVDRSVELPTEVETYCGWLLKAAPGWRTFQQRYVVLDAEDLRLRYFDAGPTASQLHFILGDDLPLGFDARKMPALDGLAAAEIVRGLKATQKGYISLKGASVSTRAWQSSDAAGLLATSPTFSVTAENGRLFAFVADTAGEMGEWVARVGQAIAEADRIFTTGLYATARKVDGLAAAAGGGGEADAPEVSLIQARRLSTVVPFRKAVKSVLPSAVGGLPAYAAFLAVREERASGYLYKVDKTRTRWAYRFFVLRGSTLSYYTDHTRRELKGSFTVGVRSVVTSAFGGSAVVGLTKPPTSHKLSVSAETEAAEGTANASVITGHAAREHFLCAPNDADARQWQDVLAVLINAHKAAAGLERFNDAALRALSESRTASSAEDADDAGEVSPSASLTAMLRSASAAGLAVSAAPAPPASVGGECDATGIAGDAAAAGAGAKGSAAWAGVGAGVAATDAAADPLPSRFEKVALSPVEDS